MCSSLNPRSVKRWGFRGLRVGVIKSGADEEASLGGDAKVGQVSNLLGS